MNSHHPCGFFAVHMKYPVKRFSTLTRIGSAGFRQLAVRRKAFLEWSTLRVWVRDGLRYCRWYYSTALSTEVSIEDFFQLRHQSVISRNFSKGPKSYKRFPSMEMLRLGCIEVKGLYLK